MPPERSARDGCRLDILWGYEKTRYVVFAFSVV